MGALPLKEQLRAAARCRMACRRPMTVSTTIAPPGDGEFPIDEIAEVLRRCGGLNLVGLEVFLGSSIGCL
jgi:hypothetical protein